MFFFCDVWSKSNECPSVGGVSITSRTGAPLERDPWSMVND